MHEPTTDPENGKEKAGPARRAGVLRLLALLCLVVGALVLGACGVRSLVVKRPRSALLPPAGKGLGGEVPFRFAVLGDNRGVRKSLTDILRAIKAERVRFVLHTGDVARHGNHEQLDWVRQGVAEAKLGVPFCAVPGNHDIRGRAVEHGERYRPYEQAFGPRQYWFSCANALFVAFDDATNTCRPDDLAWLDATLARHRKEFDACFVFLHVPPRDPRPGRTHCLKPRHAKALLPILKAHRVTAVFAGHIHSYLEDHAGAVPVFITGGAGAPRHEPEVPYHYLVCTVEPGGSFRVARRDVDTSGSTDLVEYYWRVKFRSTVALPVGLGFLAAGSLFGTISHSRKRRRMPNS